MVGLRPGKRRALAELPPFDFVVAVAIGAIVGRVPNANTTSWVEGAVTLAALVAAHRAVERIRSRVPLVWRLTEHPARVLVARGQLCDRELRAAGIRDDDLFRLLRQRGAVDLGEVDRVILESNGGVPVIRRGTGEQRGGPARRVLPTG
ncbi:uncharacterized membrane protein YcaP (DUF421 family) [Saccharopolyspora lacisalsi]|uniref:Uncharacterized membrane protein YcaP (DUF421 family) n=1 Tax=Halosaccharopolyspora lacisalsi TaxID=1000566 RepID=A0A839DP07_9PSEU|nr:uncharacterized membrane protein YcaP (DUF421 family) [Halosaccharopolyspora lacisalsi]